MANFIDRTIKASDKELLLFTDVAAILSMGPDDFRERVEVYKAYPHGSNPVDIAKSLWRWDEVAGIVANLAWFEAAYQRRKKRREERLRQARRQRRERATGRRKGAAGAPERDKGVPPG